MDQVQHREAIAEALEDEPDNFKKSLIQKVEQFYQESKAIVDGINLGYEYTIQPEIAGIKIILTGFHDKF